MTLLSKLLPLLLLVVLACIGTFVAYAIYSICTDVAATTQRKMEANNVSFSKGGMKVGVKEVGNENYVDRTQSLLVKAWNYSSLPGYKGGFWNKEAQGPQRVEARKPYTGSGVSPGVR